MQFFVPACGTEFVLDKPWTFLLYVESRNEQLFKAYGRFLDKLEWVEVDPYGYSGWSRTIPDDLKAQITSTQERYSQWSHAAQITFMPGTKLKVARVYIRNGQKGEYDSITLSLHETNDPMLIMAAGKKKKKTYGRFWVKLTDFNKIDGTVVDSNVREHKTK